MCLTLPQTEFEAFQTTLFYMYTVCHNKIRPNVYNCTASTPFTDKHSDCRHVQYMYLYQVTMEIGFYIQLQLYYKSFFFNVQDGKKKKTTYLHFSKIHVVAVSEYCNDYKKKLVNVCPVSNNSYRYVRRRKKKNIGIQKTQKQLYL